MKKLVVVALLLITSATLNAQSTGSSNQSAPEPGHSNPALNLAMGQWRFVTVAGKSVLAVGRQQPYLKFEGRNNTVTGFSGCNRLRGTYQADETKLTISQVVSTRMACAGENNEALVLKVLGSVTGYKITRHKLQLLGPDGVLAVLVRPHEEQTTRQQSSEK